MYYSSYKADSGVALTNVTNVSNPGTSKYASTVSNVAAGGDSRTFFFFDVPAGSTITNVFFTAAISSVSGILLSQSIQMHCLPCGINRETGDHAFVAGGTEWINAGTASGAWATRTFNTARYNGMNTSLYAPGIVVRLINNAAITSYKLGLAALQMNITYEEPAPPQQKAENIYLGSQKVQRLYHGDISAQKAYLGDTVVFESE